MARLTDEEFVDLVAQYRDEFYRYVLRNAWNASVADDVFSSAVMAAYEQLGKFQAGTNFRAWMYRIITNKMFVANRETQRMAIGLESVDERCFATDSDTKRRIAEDPEWFLEECGDEVHRALRQLSTAERSCFLLLAYAKFSYKEIAATLDIPVGTVMTHLARGRARMRRLLVEHAKSEGIIDENYDVANPKRSRKRSA
jgi:RNA polymerase sigma-70 factor (ECF subfamily)